MKRIIIWVLTLWAASLAANGCGNTGDEKIADQSFTAKAELQKDNIILKVITPHYLAIDSYGKPVVGGYWYLYSRIANTLTPINSSSNSLNNFSVNDLEIADIPDGGSALRMLGEVKSEEKDDFQCASYYPKEPNYHQGLVNIKVKVLLFGPRYVVTRYDGVKLIYEFKHSK